MAVPRGNGRKQPQRWGLAAPHAALAATGQHGLLSEQQWAAPGLALEPPEPRREAPPGRPKQKK